MNFKLKLLLFCISAFVLTSCTTAEKKNKGLAQNQFSLDSLLTKDQVGAENLPDDIAPVDAPFDMPEFKKPVFPDLRVSIADRGAVQETKVTLIIQSLIDSVSEQGGSPAKIQLIGDKKELKADGNDLIFVTVNILDDNDILAPRADNLVQFEVTGGGKIVGVDNGYQASMEPFKANKRKAYNGKCLVIIQSNYKNEPITLKATSEGLDSETMTIPVSK